ncbi:MAG: hypothetical protein LBG45_11185 [Dysgonamonadaceae bacterium]|nr:hypothetical protein [Dysgonamonadaceae bacterium]
MDEVVVTALGIKRDARALGYSVSSIKGDAITVAGVTANPLASLYGKAAGVGIQSTAGGPMGRVFKVQFPFSKKQLILRF